MKAKPNYFDCARYVFSKEDGFTLDAADRAMPAFLMADEGARMIRMHEIRDREQKIDEERLAQAHAAYGAMKRSAAGFGGKASILVEYALGTGVVLYGEEELLIVHEREEPWFGAALRSADRVTFSAERPCQLRFELYFDLFPKL